MKTVLCYGDSNTFGSATVPRPDGRYGPDERWPGVLRATLGSSWMLVEQGLGAPRRGQRHQADQGRRFPPRPRRPRRARQRGGGGDPEDEGGGLGPSTKLRGAVLSCSSSPVGRGLRALGATATYTREG